jgi:hypothetical protein
MTILLQGYGPRKRSVEWPLMVPQNCHPDRSVAEWRDLLFLSPVPTPSQGSADRKRIIAAFLSRRLDQVPDLLGNVAGGGTDVVGDRTHTGCYVSGNVFGLLIDTSGVFAQIAGCVLDVIARILQITL